MNQLLNEKVIAVIRAENKEEGYRLAKAIIRAGIKAIEITYTIKHAGQLIADLREEFGEDILLGAGSVLDKDTCQNAIQQGAKYIVSPIFDIDIANFCYEKNIPYIPGCMTVTEMMHAMKHHASIIKLFPGSHFEPKFIQSIKAPIPDIKVMVTGGVNALNIKEWFKNGADMVGIGGGITKRQKQDDYNQVYQKAKDFYELIKEV